VTQEKSLQAQLKAITKFAQISSQQQTGPAGALERPAASRLAACPWSASCTSSKELAIFLTLHALLRESYL